MSVFHSLVLGPGISTVFLKRPLYLTFTFPKWFFLSDMVYSERNGNGEISHYFEYQRAKLFSGNKILNWMHKCCVTSFADVFHFLLCRSTCFVAYFHISASEKLRGNEIGILYLTECKNNDKLKLSSANKKHVYSLLLTFDVLRLHVVTKRSNIFC